MLMRRLSSVASSASLSFFFYLCYRGMGQLCVHRGDTNTRSNDEDKESFYINRQNPIIKFVWTELDGKN